MKEEITRIMRLVQEGKLSPEDAAELIDAFGASETKEEPRAEAAPPPGGSEEAPPPPPPPGEGGEKEPFKSFIDFVEGIGKEVSTSVNWHEVASQVRKGAQKGVESIKQGYEEIKTSGKINFGWLSSAEIKEVTLPLSFGEGKVLKIENPCGSVKVAGGFETGSLTARAKVRGASPEDAQSKADEYTVIIEESDHQVLVRQPDVSGLEVDLVIQLAANASVEIRTQSGDIRVLDTGGACRVNSQSGDIHVRDVAGPLEVTLQNGDLKVEDCESPSISIENKSGDIHMRNVRGNVNARSASGDVLAEACCGKTFSVESVSGDVRVDIVEPIRGSVNIRTVNGDASLTVPDGCDCRVSLSTLRGHVTCDLPLTDEAKMEQRITGRLGDGTGTFDVSGINGDIAVRMRDSAASASAEA